MMQPEKYGQFFMEKTRFHRGFWHYLWTSDGGQLERIDVTNPDDPKPVFTYLPESDIGKLQNRVTELENQLTEAQLALTEQYEANLALEDEVTNTQLALTELYEATQTTTTTKEA